MAPPVLENLDRDECMRLLASVPIGRVALSVDALPVILPVNFAVVDNAVVFRTVEGTKFHAAAAGAVVAFEVDSWDPSGGSGWSVMARGRASVIKRNGDPAGEAAARVDAWAVDGSGNRFVRLDIALITGRRFYRHAVAPDPA